MSKHILLNGIFLFVFAKTGIFLLEIFAFAGMRRRLQEREKGAAVKKKLI